MTKKTIHLICFFVFFILQNAFSQSFFIENGISISSIGKEDSESNYYINAGATYLHKDFFSLSSSLGFIRKGSKTYYSTDPTIFEKASANKYVTLNTVFNVKKSFNKFLIFAGVGPRMDFYIRNSSIPKELDDIYSNLYGLHITAGISHSHKHFTYGLNFNYLPTFNKAIKTINVRDKTYGIGIRIGYTL